MEEATEFLAHVMHARRTTQPHRLMAPGPDDRQLRLLFEAAASAPDHDQILPWRFTVVEASARERLADAFAQALRLRKAFWEDVEGGAWTLLPISDSVLNNLEAAVRNLPPRGC